MCNAISSVSCKLIYQAKLGLSGNPGLQHLTSTSRSDTISKFGGGRSMLGCTCCHLCFSELMSFSGFYLPTAGFLCASNVGLVADTCSVLAPQERRLLLRRVFDEQPRRVPSSSDEEGRFSRSVSQEGGLSVGTTEPTMHPDSNPPASP